MIERRARWDGEALRLLSAVPPGLAPGEIVVVTIERGRGDGAHRHQFAWLRSAWDSLPESVAAQPWAETPDTLRKHALIVTGWHVKTVLDCGAAATAGRVKAALLAAEVRAHGYAIGQVRGPVVTMWTPASQSVRAMGGEDFARSKADVLAWIAGQIGTTPELLAAQGAPA